MNKQDWLEEAVKYIDSLNSEEFEEFIMSCVPCYNIKTNYSDILLGNRTNMLKKIQFNTILHSSESFGNINDIEIRKISVSPNRTFSEPANDICYAETMSLAA
jgi:hypothetical protein